MDQDLPPSRNADPAAPAEEGNPADTADRPRNAPVLPSASTEPTDVTSVDVTTAGKKNKAAAPAQVWLGNRQVQTLQIGRKTVRGR